MTGEAEGIRWGRALLGAVLVEILLGIVSVPTTLLSADPNATMNLVIPPASFVAAFIVVAWLFRRSPRPVAHGVATGIGCALLYVLLAMVAYAVVPGRVDMSQSLGAPYIASHILKVVGGWAAGLWLQRKSAAA